MTCRVDPAAAFLRVEDDGEGWVRARDDSYGMEIMRERAARLGAHLSVATAAGGGTVVEVTIGRARSGRPGPVGDDEGGARVHDRCCSSTTTS